MNSPVYLAPRHYIRSDRDEWRRMRTALWPPDAAESEGEQLADMEAWLSQINNAVLVVPRIGGPAAGLAGFAEIGTRSYAESCDSSPVAYLEGWYVDPDMRRRGVGTALILAGEDWARHKGFREFASDTPLSNTLSQRAHTALGFTEVERLVAYRKVL